MQTSNGAMGNRRRRWPVLGVLTLLVAIALVTTWLTVRAERGVGEPKVAENTYVAPTTTAARARPENRPSRGPLAPKNVEADLRKPVKDIVAHPPADPRDEAVEYRRALRDSGVSSEPWTAAAKEALGAALARVGGAGIQMNNPECYVAGCVVSIQFDGLAAHQDVMRVMERTEEIRAFPRILTAPLEEAGFIRQTWILLRPDNLGTRAP